MMKKTIRSLALGLCLCLSATAVSAGGVHYQVSTSTRFMADQAGNMQGFRMNWVYDPEVSAIIVDGRDLSNGGLRKMGEDIMADLYSLGYYIQFTANDQPVPIKKVEQFTIELVEEGSILLGMQVNLKQPVPVAGKIFRLKLVDPDGSARLVYSGVDRIVLDNNLVKKCAAPTLESAKLDLSGHEVDVQTASVACR